MSIVKLGDLDARHSVQPVVLRKKGMESVDRDAMALQIDAEVAAVRQGQIIPAFRGYHIADADENPAEAHPLDEAEESID